MDDARYIEMVKKAFESSDNTAKSINDIAAIELPKEAGPLITLIHGDALQLQNAVKYAKNDDPASPSNEDIKKLSDELSNRIKQKLERYLKDWNDDNTYRYEFELKATYGTFINDRGDVGYVDIIDRYTPIKTVTNALQFAQEWESRLLERVKIYTDQEICHKRISVKPTYVIRDKNSLKVAAGTLEFNNGYGISTWLNQI